MAKRQAEHKGVHLEGAEGKRLRSDLRAMGFTVLRFDERQLEEEPERVAADVARSLRVSVPSRG